MAFLCQPLGGFLLLVEGVEAFAKGSRVLLSIGNNWRQKRRVASSEVVAAIPHLTNFHLAALAGSPRIAFQLLMQETRLCMDDWVVLDSPLSSIGKYVLQFAKLFRLRTLSLVDSTDQKVAVLKRGGDIVLDRGAAGFGAELRTSIISTLPRLAIASSRFPMTKRLKEVLPSQCAEVGLVGYVPSPADAWNRRLLNLALLPVGIRGVVKNWKDSRRLISDALSILLLQNFLKLERESVYSIDNFQAAINCVIQQRYARQVVVMCN